MDSRDRTASLMTPSKLAQIRPKTVASPAAWLSQMAADAGHVHVRRLAEVQGALQSQAALRDVASLMSQLARLAEALPGLDFGLLGKRGWWARATGKGRSGGAQFAGQFGQIEQVARGADAQTQALAKKQVEQAAAGDLTLLDLEVEYQAIDKVIDQGARWLQDMRAQIKARQGAVPDAAAQEQLEDDEARCDILVTRLKLLRGVSSAAQQLHQHARDAALRRAALAQLLQRVLAPAVGDWHDRVGPLAAAAADDGDVPAPSVEDAMEAHRELQLCIKKAIADGRQLQAQERILAEGLAAFGSRLEAA